ncbi:MAG: dihydrodipicolinate synthase family protein, partial [Thermoguttaceae bacterium]|nr:dihydrodipicolinate synthase family protein [Thermoguttaceae bacterium]
MVELKKGFYTALGTPLDHSGRIVTKSLAQQVETQIACEASGLFLLGSMGMQCAIKSEECFVAAKVATDAAHGKIPILFGVMDNSIERIMDRIEQVRTLPLDGVVVTPPYYFISNDASQVNLYTAIADRSPFPVYLYDLPALTKMKITYEIAAKLAHHPNVRGIKTQDPQLVRLLMLDDSVSDDFALLFSKIDLFDVVWSYGCHWNLDGMFDAAPRNSQLAYRHFLQGNRAEGTRYLNR